jgi:hypothetical protein
MKDLRSKGYGVRAVSRLLGIATQTVVKYTRNDGAKCPCGKSASHNGWCKFRNGRDQEKKGWAYRSDVNARKSRRNEAVKKKRLWLLLDDFTGEPLPRREWYEAIGEVNACTGKVHDEWRDDVRQTMIVAALEGRLARDDIRKAVSTFVWYFKRGGYMVKPTVDLSPRAYDRIFWPDSVNRDNT